MVTWVAITGLAILVFAAFSYTASVRVDLSNETTKLWKAHNELTDMVVEGKVSSIIAAFNQSLTGNKRPTVKEDGEIN